MLTDFLTFFMSSPGNKFAVKWRGLKAHATDPFVSADSEKTEQCAQFVHRDAVAGKNAQ